MAEGMESRQNSVEISQEQIEDDLQEAIDELKDKPKQGGFNPAKFMKRFDTKPADADLMVKVLQVQAMEKCMGKHHELMDCTSSIRFSLCDKERYAFWNCCETFMAEQKKLLGLEGYTAALVAPWKLKGRTAIDFRN